MQSNIPNPKTCVKALSLVFALLAVAFAAPAGDAASPRPHMMYFYNPSCRMCTKTNEIVGAAEEKYKAEMSSQRFNIADNKTGVDNVLYMFDLLDEMAVPAEETVTLVVFLGLLETDPLDGELYFSPVRVLVEGEDIIAKLDAEVADFLSTGGKGGKTLGFVRPESFFLVHDRVCRDAGS